MTEREAARTFVDAYLRRLAHLGGAEALAAALPTTAALALLHAAPSAEPARCRACLRLAVLRLGAVEAAARRVLGIEARP